MDPIRFDPDVAGGLTRPQAIDQQKGPDAPGGEGSQFAANLKSLVSEVNDLQVQADESVAELAAGRASNIHEVVVNVAKADLSFKLLLELRNKLVEAYQKTMNMQV